jgi:hypothetical protein
MLVKKKVKAQRTEEPFTWSDSEYLKLLSGTTCVTIRYVNRLTCSEIAAESLQSRKLNTKGSEDQEIHAQGWWGNLAESFSSKDRGDWRILKWILQ